LTRPFIGAVVGGDTLRVYTRRVALWEFISGSGFAVYLYENSNWDIKDKWLLYSKLKDYDEALVKFNRVVNLLD